MKKFLIVLFFLVFATPIYADNWRKGCEVASAYATAIMESRQAGVAMSRLMELTKEEGPKDDQSLIEMIIIDAYDRPRYSTEPMQQRAMEEFRDDTYLKCVKTNKK
ncbi:hypothetical protein [Nitrosomonas sp. Nm33]|uniref:hypothetical protein n=1 Tax=Nitrosomonas sp. Nm33 TaxID=133724 RepID=UPI00089746FF|nr:hypothetical protein [Nitrosomonas sp. Nm33]SDY98096.1 hypothetical protein SAMN05421755_10762 [Nitrosomonas sp. Nm33]